MKTSALPALLTAQNARFSRRFEPGRGGNSIAPHHAVGCFMQVYKCEARPASGVERLDDVAWRIEAEFREMPGMRLTSAQVMRLWNLTRDQCTRVLDYLTSMGTLVQDEDQRFHLVDGAS